jgi:proteic killer suppression protein
MIRTFKHKGFRLFFETGSVAGIQPQHKEKLRLRLAAINTAVLISDLDLPGYRLHSLSGNRKGIWSIVVNGNWRITFEFHDGNAYIINYEDYH